MTEYGMVMKKWSEVSVISKRRGGGNEWTRVKLEKKRSTMIRVSI